MLYSIPLFERCIGERHDSKVKCLEVDGVGIFVYYENGKELDPKFIRSCLVGRKDTSCIVEADSPEKAIETFLNEWEGARIGTKYVALWINPKKPIKELPSCELLRKNKRDQYICGEEVGEDGNGEYGGCVLECYDPPDECPIKDFNDSVYELEEAGKLPVKTISFAGQLYQIISARDIMPERACSQT